MTDEAREAVEEEDPPLGGLFETNRWITSVMADEVPDLIAVQDRLIDSLRPLNLAVHETMDATDPVQQARSRITLQAANDFFDVLFEATSGRGRPAIRSARSLYEHLVNHRWTSVSPAEAQRYVDHAAIGALLDLQLDTPTEDEFTGNERRAFRHWRQKLEKRVIPAAAAVLEEYGSSFQARWTATNLFDRAKAHGLDGEYPNYRLTSAVIHGSAGGDLGHRREKDGIPILRTGPALAICPLALRLGVRYYGLLLADVESAVGRGATSRMQDLVVVIEGQLDAHRDVCFGLDETIWPPEVPRTVLCLKVSVEGRWSWMLRDPERALTVLADHSLPAEQLDRVTASVAKIEEANPGRTKPLFIRVAGTGKPRPGAPWLPVSETLKPQELTFGPKPNYSWLKVRDPLNDPSLYD